MKQQASFLAVICTLSLSFSAEKMFKGPFLMLKFTPEVLYGVNTLNRKSAHLIVDTLATIEGNILEFSL